MSRYLDPRSDVVFKKIFGEHEHLLISFLNSLLPLPSDGLIKSLDYLPTEQIPKIPILKRTIVDVKCTDQQGRIFIVEMQIEWSSFFMERMLFGASRAYVNQLKKGEEYEYLKPVYGLGLLAENFDHESADFYHHYKIVNVKKPSRELKGLQFVFIELDKFKPSNMEQRKLGVLWLRFLSEINENTHKADPQLLAVPEIRQAIELSEESAYTPAELESYNSYWDQVSNEKTMLSEREKKGYSTGFDDGEKTGFEKGEKTGFEKGERTGFEKGERTGFEKGERTGFEKGERIALINVAENLLKQGAPLPIISKVTGFSEKELKSIFKKLT